MAKVILTDVDDACLDWSTPFAEWVLTKYAGRWNPLTPRLQDHINIEAWLGCTIEETRALVKEFNSDPNYWPNFEPLPGAVEAIARLHAKGYDFVAITACASDDWTHENRYANLRRAFGNAFDTLHCVGLGQSKVPYLSRYRPTYWIEDKISHAVDGAELGHKPFLMQYGHSAGFNDPRIENVNSWLEIEDLIDYQAQWKAVG